MTEHEIDFSAIHDLETDELDRAIEERLFEKPCKFGIGRLYWHEDGSGFPAYHAYIAYAWVVVEHLEKTRDLRLGNLQQRPPGEPGWAGEWRANFVRDTQAEGRWSTCLFASGYGRSPAEALCRAALLTLGEEYWPQGKLETKR